VSLLRPDDVRQHAQQHTRSFDAAEKRLKEATDEALKKFLKRLRSETRSSLTASSVDPLKMNPQLFTVGAAQGWWQSILRLEMEDALLEVWRSGRSATSDAALSVGQLDAAGDFIAKTVDRLSRTATPTIPEQAFDTVRKALIEEMADDRSPKQMAERLAAELQWQGEDRGYWDSRQKGAERRLNEYLDDNYGPKYTADPATGEQRLNQERDLARRTDPEADRIQKQISQATSRLDRDQSTWQARSERIARTETTAAYNAGIQSAYLDEEVGYKMWIALGDARTRETHIEAHGQTVKADEWFNVGNDALFFPGDPSGSAQEVINCRCTTIAADSPEDLERMIEDVEGPVAVPPMATDQDIQDLGSLIFGDTPDDDEEEMGVLSDYPGMYVQDPQALDQQPIDQIGDLAANPSASTIRDIGDNPIIDAEDAAEMYSEREWRESMILSNEAWGEELSEDQMRAIQDYAGTGAHRTVNATLRYGDINDAGQDTREMITNLDEAIEMGTIDGPRDMDGDMVLYRAFDDPELLARIESGEEMIGAVYTDKGFVSTTADINVAEKFYESGATGHTAEGPRIICSIDIEKGMPAAVLDAADLGAGEKEVILPRDSTFVIKDIARDGDRIEIQFEAVSREDAQEMRKDQMATDPPPASEPASIFDRSALTDEGRSALVNGQDFGTHIRLASGSEYIDLEAGPFKHETADWTEFHDRHADPRVDTSVQGLGRHAIGGLPPDGDKPTSHNRLITEFTNDDKDPRYNTVDTVNEAAAHWSYVGNKNIQDTLRAGGVDPTSEEIRKAALKAGRNPQEFAQIMQQRADTAIVQLDHGIDTSRDHGGFVGYRGSNLKFVEDHMGPDIAARMEGAGGQDPRSLIGMEYTDKAYTATSVDPDIAKGFCFQQQFEDGFEDHPPILYEIVVPDGIGALSINGTSAGSSQFEEEAEMLLARDQKFRVVDVVSPYEPETYKDMKAAGIFTRNIDDEPYDSVSGEQPTDMLATRSMPIIVRVEAIE